MTSVRWVATAAFPTRSGRQSCWPLPQSGLSRAEKLARALPSHAGRDRHREWRRDAPGAMSPTTQWNACGEKDSIVILSACQIPEKTESPFDSDLTRYNPHLQTQPHSNSKKNNSPYIEIIITKEWGLVYRRSSGLRRRSYLEA